MLNATTAGPLIVVTVFSLEYREFAANWHHAIVRFGHVQNLLVVAFGERHLVECLTLGLPCYNGTNLATNDNLNRSIDPGGTHYNRLMWARPMILNEILKRHYSVLLSDLDTVWVKDVLHSLYLAADHHDADIVGMNDDWRGTPNGGNLFFRNNDRTRRLVETWLNIGYDASTHEFRPAADVSHEHATLLSLDKLHWQACNSSTSCMDVQDAGLAAVWLHPWHGMPHRGEVLAERAAGYCSDDIAYIHLVSAEGSTVHKKHMAKELGVWFVGANAHMALMVGASAQELINVTHSHRHVAMLPCATDVAWLTGEARTSRGP